MADTPTAEDIVDRISTETLRLEIAEFKAKIKTRETLLALKEEAARNASSGGCRNGPTSPHDKAGKLLRGKAAIEYVLAHDDRSTWTPAEMTQAQRDLGLDPSAQSIRVIMSRLARSGEMVERVRDGVYKPKTSQNVGNPQSAFPTADGGGEGD